MRARVKWMLVALAAVVVLATAGPFVYINFIEGDPPKPLAFSDTSTSAGAGSTATHITSIDGTWTIAAGSQVGYRIKETLFGQSTEAVGRTAKVTGQLTAAGTAIAAASFTVDMASVSSDQSQRDGQFRGRIMDVSRFPTATFNLTSPIDIGAVPPDGQQVNVNASGDLTLHGTTKPVTFDLAARTSGGHIEVNGSLDVTFADFGIDNPSAGPARTEDHGLLEVLLVLARP